MALYSYGLQIRHLSKEPPKRPPLHKFQIKTLFVAAMHKKEHAADDQVSTMAKTTLRAITTLRVMST